MASKIGSSPGQPKAAMRGKQWNVKEKRYKRGEYMGTGAFGIVFKAEDQKSRAIVALKVMKLSDFRHLKLDRRELLRKMQTEKNVMKKCDHVNIVKLLDHYQNKPTELTFVMEFCSGGSLQNYVFKNGPLNERTTRKFSAQIRDALLYLQTLEITHRNLKPANILLTEDSDDATLKLTDFGEAALKTYDENGNTAYQTFAGTGCYMAPEVLAKRGTTLQDKYGSNADLWSFGVVIYEMLTKSRPHREKDGRTLLEVMRTEKVNVEKIPIDTEGKKLLVGLLKPNKEDRKWDIIDPKNPNCNKWLSGIAKSTTKDRGGWRQRVASRQGKFIEEQEFAGEVMSEWMEHSWNNIRGIITMKLAKKYNGLDEEDADAFSNDDESKENGDGIPELKSNFQLLMDRMAAEFLFGVLMESMKAMKERKSKICQMIAKQLHIEDDDDQTAEQMVAAMIHPQLQQQWEHYFKSKMENQHQIDLPDIDTVVNGLYNVVTDKEPYSSLQFLNDIPLKTYIKECAEICWIMILMKPELSFYPTSFRAIYDDEKEDYQYDEKEKHDLREGSKTENGAKIIYFAVPTILKRNPEDKETVRVLSGQPFVHNDQTVVKYIMSHPDELINQQLVLVD